jgi:hypothetical protein
MKIYLSSALQEALMLMQKGQVLSEEDEDLLYSGFLDGYEGRPYSDPRQLLTHYMTIYVPIDADWYRWGFLLGQTFRRNNRN